MNKISVVTINCVLAIAIPVTVLASTCPDPVTSHLRGGIVPPPWQVSAFSPRPQADSQTEFVRANILVAGLGQGVACTYRNRIGDYSIWWPVPTNIPARQSSYWIAVNGGYACSESLMACEFNTLK